VLETQKAQQCERTSAREVDCSSAGGDAYAALLKSSYGLSEIDYMKKGYANFDDFFVCSFKR
jgi:hypothetical protein